MKPSGRYPAIELNDETMREGMQIESADISVEDKVRLIDALSETGLTNIFVGSFVSPRYTPQMASVEELMRRFTPRPGVSYKALALNQRGLDRAAAYTPPLAPRPVSPRLMVHLCDTFVRRNTNQSQAQEIGRWATVVELAQAAGIAEAGLGLNAAWGSNFEGEFTSEQRMAMLARQHGMWTDAGIAVKSVWLGDPMSWCRPDVVEDQLADIISTWPDIDYFYLHLHNARGLALPSMYAALRVLTPEHTLGIDSTLGGIGGCPYCGNGRATGMAATEDLVAMLDGMGYDTGVDMDKLIRAVWLLEDVLGRQTLGHVSKAGPRPSPEHLYDPNLPFIETFEQAKHFLIGTAAYEDGDVIRPWSVPIPSPSLPGLNLAHSPVSG
jgi:hydroxymethylglutaryl-CoA lyase